MSKPAAPGRRFGLEIGVVAIIAAALLLGKQQVVPGIACLSLGFALLCLAFARPAALSGVAGRWLALSAALSRFTTPIVLGLLYFVILTPMALLRRTLGTSPFARDGRADSYWVAATARTREERRARMERQF